MGNLSRENISKSIFIFQNTNIDPVFSAYSEYITINVMVKPLYVKRNVCTVGYYCSAATVNSWGGGPSENKPNNYDGKIKILDGKIG